MQATSPWIQAIVNGNQVAIIDTGATISVVSNNFVHPTSIKHDECIQIGVGNGQTMFTEGSTDIALSFGNKTVVQGVRGAN